MAGKIPSEDRITAARMRARAMFLSCILEPLVQGDEKKNTSSGPRASLMTALTEPACVKSCSFATSLTV
eukprot:6835765-Alexandrium_andersonii.AAC.1